MNILVTGANGQLGNEMRVLSEAHPKHTYFFTDIAGVGHYRQSGGIGFCGGQRH